MKTRFLTALLISTSLSIACSGPLLMAQTPADAPVLDPDKLATQPRPKPKKPVSRHTPTDNVSDELNRAETARVEQMMQQMKEQGGTQLPAAAPAAVPAPSAAPIVTASLTPTAPVQNVAAPPAAVSAPASTANPAAIQQLPIQQLPMEQSPVQQAPVKQAQATPPAPPAAPAPVPIQPSPAAPAAVPPAAPVVDAPSRPFGQSQQVPTQQPTLSLEVNKGTALKLPGAASTVFVAAPDIADVQVKSPGMIYVFAKKAGDTVLYAVDAQDHVLLNTIVHVTSPIGRMKAGLDAIHPNNGVTFDNQGETIVLGGSVRSTVVAEDARRLALQHVGGAANKVINNIRVDAPTQVQLRVKIAEVSRSSLKRVGINLQNVGSIALFGAGPTTGFATSTVQAVGGQASAAAGLQTSGGLSGFIDLLATQGEANILAEPSLVAMSGETANFLAGGEIPVIAPQASAGTSTFSVTYKQVGVSLAFTPTIVGDRINLKVAPEVSQITTDGQVSVPISTTASIIIPAIQTRRASTTVELGSGQGFAIGGLLMHNTNQTIQKVPALGDVPILGSLFKSDAYQRTETELVIIVTPYFVEPSSQPLRTPLTGRVPPTDADRLLYQRFNHPTAPATMAVSGGSNPAAGATAGFRLE
jgi:pilus assembly protein CpaC